MEKVKTKFGNITRFTADDPETVTEIHQIVKRSQEAAQKIFAAAK